MHGAVLDPLVTRTRGSFNRAVRLLAQVWRWRSVAHFGVALSALSLCVCALFLIKYTGNIPSLLNQRGSGGEARGAVRGDADDAMGERGAGAVEDGGPGGATKEGRAKGPAEEKGEKERGDG